MEFKDLAFLLFVTFCYYCCHCWWYYNSVLNLTIKVSLLLFKTVLQNIISPSPSLSYSYFINSQPLQSSAFGCALSWIFIHSFSDILLVSFLLLISHDVTALCTLLSSFGLLFLLLRYVPLSVCERNSCWWLSAFRHFLFTFFTFAFTLTLSEVKLLSLKYPVPGRGYLYSYYRICKCKSRFVDIVCF